MQYFAVKILSLVMKTPAPRWTLYGHLIETSRDTGISRGICPLTIFVSNDEFVFSSVDIENHDVIMPVLVIIYSISTLCQKSIGNC